MVSYGSGGVNEHRPADLVQRGELLAVVVHVEVGHRLVAAALDGSRAVE
jgi:hypothetical protein